MTKTIAVTADHLASLDLSPVRAVFSQDPYPQDLRFEIDFPRDPSDPRELSEIPEVRLWFVRVDAAYPWLILSLDWAAELARYTAMLVPHEFHRTEGILYNPEALELFVMGKLFTLHQWFMQQNLPSRHKLHSLAQLWGYELDEAFWQMLESGC